MISTLWSVPIGTHQFAQANDVNPILARVFQAMRVTDQSQETLSEEKVQDVFYASDDQLLSRVQLPEFQALIQFFVDSIQKTVSSVNANVWPTGKISMQLQIMGCWFQIQNGRAFHDVHTHGNCSWSGVYYVQLDELAKRVCHPHLKEFNGVTRFYGPYTQWQAGAYMDLGNAYLQKNHVDIQPEVGKLIIFPSFLPHQAMAYEGELDRMIVSFNAQIHSKDGNQLFSYDAR
jgi:uncharacterized protein (TIGR02466 family)